VVFSSITFLFFFLPVALGVYAMIGKRFRNAWLLVCSLVFYVWGAGALVSLLLISTFVDYGFGRLVSYGRSASSRLYVRLGITGSVLVNLSLLGFFKYANFAVEQFNSLGQQLGFEKIAWTSVALPIGISFFTFQSMSYTLDIAKGRAEHLRNPIDFALYVSLFPQLIAGPIVRFHEISDEIRDRTVTLDGFADGVTRFVHGLSKKVLIADSIAPIADAAFSVPVGDLSGAAAWLGMIAYTLQIYFDFSGYSDMAIGLGLMFGFRFPENFRRPYSAVSVTDFWRRWHITLSNWFRDYVYFSLGGSRSGSRRAVINLWIVFTLTGIWHGANWTFLFWGLYHGLILVTERRFGLRGLDDEVSRRTLRRTITLLLVMVGWVLFRAPNIGAALGYMASLADFGTSLTPSMAAALTNRALLILVASSFVVLMSPDIVGGPSLTSRRGVFWTSARYGELIVALPLTAILIASGSFSPFLYFQF
jgi:alginate O-acetyltransferase complex protein AlgI